MAGGSGTRLWPLSRAARPKQFLMLNGDKTMLQQTLERLSGLPTSESITICNEEHRFFVAEQMREIGAVGKIILEPVSRSTAPAVALAALEAQDEDALLLVLPADHVVLDEDAFRQSVELAIPLAQAGKLVTFGIAPTEAHTGYGYIRVGEEIECGFKVATFTEKPDADTAANYLSSGGYFWNSGMFLFKASSYLSELSKYRPDISGACEEAFSNSSTDLDFIRLDPVAFEACPEDSIDYAVMERTEHAVVVPMEAGWNDIGSWSSLWELSEKDGAGNSTTGDVILLDVTNSMIKSESQLVTLIGVDDLTVVSTRDALLVASRHRVEDTKAIVSTLKSGKRSEWELGQEVYRPWGRFTSVDSGSRYQVKRITVAPGSRLSLQRHQYRAEHWVVVSGVARVTIGEKVFSLHENESTFIPIGTTHCLENESQLPLTIIEIQTGNYLGEDDIERFSDLYGRA
jgi:mannose-1-phosphate guanylyltransferase